MAEGAARLMKIATNECAVQTDRTNREPERARAEGNRGRSRTISKIAAKELAKNNSPREESEELYRYTIAGIITIVYSCGYRRFVLEIDEYPELRASENNIPFSSQGSETNDGQKSLAGATAMAYTRNLWTNSRQGGVL